MAFGPHLGYMKRTKYSMTEASPCRRGITKKEIVSPLETNSNKRSLVKRKYNVGKSSLAAAAQVFLTLNVSAIVVFVMARLSRENVGCSRTGRFAVP
jgi:hypothetical protein